MLSSILNSGMRTIQYFEIVFYAKNSPSMALRDLAHNPIGPFSFRFLLSSYDTTTVSGDEKSLASKLA